MKAEDSGVKVVIASGVLDPKLKTDLALAGVRHLVDKPYDLDQNQK
jgi:hypothetical protein